MRSTADDLSLATSNLDALAAQGSLGEFPQTSVSSVSTDDGAGLGGRWAMGGTPMKYAFFAVLYIYIYCIYPKIFMYTYEYICM
jgi:hypothetical protein